MIKFSDLEPGLKVKGIEANETVEIVSIEMNGPDVAVLHYKNLKGYTNQTVLYSDELEKIEIVRSQLSDRFVADGEVFRSVAEAYRIKLAHLFDPLLAIHSSQVEPLPHQITAVYQSMLTRKPIRFLLADDPGAGKTIMAGLLIKELIARGDLRRCLIICPGGLVEQWQGELLEKFNLIFQIMTREGIDTAPTGNWLQENDLAIAKMDMMARDEELLNQIRMLETEFDLVVVDEAHKMSASFYGLEAKYTKRYNLGKVVSSKTRSFLLMTATPHNGKNEDFFLFMGLLDPDRFEGKPRNSRTSVAVDDLMRRMIKEDLLTFEGKKLFPERRAYTKPFSLSRAEDELYQQVTSYVKEQFNLADKLTDKRKTGTVGFALTVLQRRLASSPAAIYSSLKRRVARLENRKQQIVLQRATGYQLLDNEEIDELEDTPDEMDISLIDKVADEATASETIDQLEKEIRHLTQLVTLAQQVLLSGNDAKWVELSSLLQYLFQMGGNADSVGESVADYDVDEESAVKPDSHQKLVIFTEHKDTLLYLKDRIERLFGQAEPVEVIHGGVNREQRRRAQERFLHNRDVKILLANDAAGEGINLQKAHLMVNYDLPWNPNRLEQRFGRIHRIGQKEVCHLWNLVATETREGEVYSTLLAKMEEVRRAMGGKVFDVLGRLEFGGKTLRDLLIEAIRYGDDPVRKAEMEKIIEGKINLDQIRELLEEKALARDTMDINKVMTIREEMERAEAKRLQPHFLESFFIYALGKLNGRIHPRENKRFEVSHVPAAIRNWKATFGRKDPILERYDRITFDKSAIRTDTGAEAKFIFPGHPLLDTVVGMTIEKHADVLQTGAVLVDDLNLTEQPRLLIFLEHAVEDGSGTGDLAIISKRHLFVEIDGNNKKRHLNVAPYLDYRPLKPNESTVSDILKWPELQWLSTESLKQAESYAMQTVVRAHLEEIRTQRLEQIEKIRVAVNERLTLEINYWDRQAQELKEKENVGKINANLNSKQARERADQLSIRQRERLKQLENQKAIRARPPVMSGMALIIPAMLLKTADGQTQTQQPTPEAIQISAEKARDLIMQTERDLGFEPIDREMDKLGYDIESLDKKPGGRTRFIEVKGRSVEAQTITITKNEILYSLNNPENYILAIVLFSNDVEPVVYYIRQPFNREPDFGVTSVNYKLSDLLERATAPC